MPTRLLFIDCRVADYQALVDGLSDRAQSPVCVLYGASGGFVYAAASALYSD